MYDCVHENVYNLDSEEKSGDKTSNSLPATCTLLCRALFVHNMKSLVSFWLHLVFMSFLYKRADDYESVKKITEITKLCFDLLSKSPFYSLYSNLKQHIMHIWPHPVKVIELY